MKLQLTVYFTYIFIVYAGIVAYSCQSDSRPNKNTGSGNSFDNRRSPLMLDLIRAEEMFAAGEPHQALELIDELASKQPQWADPYLLKGNILTTVSQNGRARSAYEKLVKIDPDYLSAWFKLGNNAYKNKQYRQAINFYNQELTGKQANVLQSKDKQITMLQIGRCYMHLGEADSALIIYKKCIKIDSLYSEVMGDLARLYTDNGEYKTAIDFANKAVALDKKNIDYQYSLGTVYLKTNQYMQAVTYLQAVADQRPFYEGVYYNLGQAFIRSGNNITGSQYLLKADSIQTLYSNLENLKLATDKNPDNQRQWLELAKAYDSVGMKAAAGQARLAAQFTSTLKIK